MRGAPLLGCAAIQARQPPGARYRRPARWPHDARRPSRARVGRCRRPRAVEPAECAERRDRRRHAPCALAVEPICHQQTVRPRLAIDALDERDLADATGESRTRSSSRAPRSFFQCARSRPRIAIEQLVDARSSRRPARPRPATAGPPSAPRAGARSRRSRRGARALGGRLAGGADVALRGQHRGERFARGGEQRAALLGLGDDGQPATSGAPPAPRTMRSSSGCSVDQPLPPLAGAAGEEDEADRAGGDVGPLGEAAGEADQLVLAASA